ncbi:MAG: pyridoxal phosphate-dependent aminotransferase [Acidobacteria bacterium]|nr:pyridoxal phosphate-dependent aminotransferase [Acidobacteriota bacterium]
MSTAETGRVLSSEYMHWAKTTHARARFNLANSGMRHYPLARLPVSLADLELSGPSFYGYAPLQEAIARKCGVAAECVVAANGTSMANHLAMAALVRPGDEVLIEHPAYELLVSTALYLGAQVRRFARKFGDGFRLDPSEIGRALTPRTRLVVVTNLHNPSGALADEATLKEIGEAARRVGARVLVDEVYLDATAGTPPRTSLHLGDQFVVTNSLTKVYGLSGLRCGWVLAEPGLARRVWRLNDLFGAMQPHPAERLSVVALAHLDRVGAQARALLEANRPVFNRFLASRDDLDAPPVEHGTISFPRLKGGGGDVERLSELLAEKYETSVVPGRFFEMPDHFRVGIALDTDVLAEGLARLGAALDELKKTG